MSPYYLGIDSGSTQCKSVLFDGAALVDSHCLKTGWDPQRSARESREALLERNALVREDVLVVTTGYGREAIEGADFSFTEISCHALGALHLEPRCSGVIDIGGQDSKVIKIECGKVSNFMMNDKCAAGTGRFLSMAADTLGIGLEDIDDFTSTEGALPIASMCTVFAESEIIGALAQQKDRSQIMAGVLRSIAQKIQQMTSKLAFDADALLLMTGGLARSAKLVAALEEATGLTVRTHEQALFAGALGACVCARDKRR